MNARILLVDDHAMFRSGLRVLIEREPTLQLVGEANDGRTAVSKAAELHPDVVVMDLRLPNLNGIDATRQILAASPDMKVVGLSANYDARSVANMLHAGASAYVKKDSAFDELVTAIRTVMTGNLFLSPSIAAMFGNNLLQAAMVDGASVFKTLSPREREVLQLISEGKATKQVAMHLSVSVKTAETHRRNLMEKLNVDNVAELTKYAIREGLTSL